MVKSFSIFRVVVPFLFSATAASLLAATPPFIDPQTGKTAGTGAKRPTAAQWAWGEANLIKTKAVAPNRIGLERMNQVRAQKGQRPMTWGEAGAVAVGTEAAGAAGSGTMSTPGALPTGVDNSTLKYFPPVRSQGSLGSCAQFSAVYYTLTHMTAMARDWDAKGGGDTFRFSPKFTYNMLNGGADSGSWHYDAYGIAQKHGLITWAAFPYDADCRSWCADPAAWRDALNVRANTSGKVLDVDTATGLDQLKQLLVNGYILNFATYIYSWQYKTIGNDTATTADDSLVGKQIAYMVNGTSGGHAMTIVGYNDDVWVDLNGDGIVTANEKGALRIANSWGTGWGEAGFCWMAYEAIRTRNPASTSEGIFWYDEATWVTARTSYSPKLIAQFDLNHLKRNQLQMTLGVSDTGAITPATIWSPYRVLSGAGGAYAFDGSTIATKGSFCLDLTDLVPSAGGAKRYYLGMRDSTAGDMASMLAMKIIDPVHGTEATCASVPKYADANQVYAYVDYDTGTGVLPPVATLNATPTSVNIGDLVTFDASGSTSPNGPITSVIGFGDGQAATAQTTTHSYNAAGKFNSSVTVTDSTGASSTASVVVTVADPTIVNAPSGLTATAVGSLKVNLSWVDNSSNELGFVVERGVKSAKGSITYTQITTTGANAKGFTDAVPAAGSYYYRVYATASPKNSTYSPSVTVRAK